jgi:hypothetical protein
MRAPSATARGRSTARPANARPVTRSVAGIGGILAVGALGAWFLAVPHDGQAMKGSRANGSQPPITGTRLLADRPPARAPNPIPPWRATRENSPPVSEGQVTAWMVRPPGPHDSKHRPVEPPAPPDPQTTTPSMRGPGAAAGE